MARIASIVGGRFALGVLAAALALGVVIVAVSSLRGADAGPGAAVTAEPIPVDALSADYSDLTLIESAYPGLVEARRSSALGFETGGRVAEISADVGDRVVAGQSLARLDTRSLAASLAAARAQAAAADAQARLAEVTLERRRTLVEQGHVSAQALDQAEADYNAARASAAASRATADQVRVQIDLATLTAPYDAVIVARSLDEGAVAAPGGAVLTLVEDSALEIRVGLPAGQARKITPGELYPFDIAGEQHTARLRAQTGVISSGARSVEAVFDLEDAAGVQSGAVARLLLSTELRQRGFWAPLSALSEGRRGLWSVYALVAEGDAWRLEPRPVEILHSEGDRVFLTGAVEEGSLILSAGVHRVTPGQRVAPRREG
ncbi:MAG: efflux RND transporter periplasmic adaptor subunit [Oceanicaulis sp.]